MVVALGALDLNAQEHTRGFRGPLVGSIRPAMTQQEESSPVLVRFVEANRALGGEHGLDDLVPLPVAQELLDHPFFEGPDQDRGPATGDAPPADAWPVP